MSNFFKLIWNDPSKVTLTKSQKRAEDVKPGDVIDAGKHIRDIVVSVDKHNNQIYIICKNYRYMVSKGEMVSIFDVEKSNAGLTKSEVIELDKAVFKAALVNKDNPWAICTAQLGRDSEKYEACVQHVKAKLGKAEEMGEDGSNTDLLTT